MCPKMGLTSKTFSVHIKKSLLVDDNSLTEHYVLGCLLTKVEKRMQAERKCKEMSEIIMKDLNKLLPKEWSVYLLGSVVTGIATDNSDIDVYIDQNNTCYYKEMKRHEKIKSLEKLLFYFLTNYGIKGSLFELQRVVHEARVPIVRSIHVPSGVKVDLSTVNGLGVENSRLLRVYLNSDPRVKWLVLTVLEWTKEIGVLGEIPMFRPYALIWLVLFFLMETIPPVVCPVIELQKDGPKTMIAGWNCTFSNCLPETYNKHTRVQLLIQFLEFIIVTDFKDNVVCPLTGNLFPRRIFKNSNLLPSCFDIYKEKFSKKKDKEFGLLTDTAICVQDPVELSHNVTKQVDPPTLAKLVEMCICSHSMSCLLLDPITNNEDSAINKEINRIDK